MKKFWQVVSKPYFFFGLAIFAIVIVISLIQSTMLVKVDFGADAVDISSSKYSMNIPYDMVDSIELTAMPDRGEEVDGFDDLTLRTGQWANDEWGSYYVCANLNVTDCIVVRLTDGRIFVFSYKSNDATAEVYETFQSHLGAQ